jgi:hypothetical protein
MRSEENKCSTLDIAGQLNILPTYFRITCERKAIVFVVIVVHVNGVRLYL